MARTILEHNDRNEPIWYGKLAEVLEDRLDPHQVSWALDCDRDCGIVTSKWENTDGQWSYNLYLRDECAAQLRGKPKPPYERFQSIPEGHYDEVIITNEYPTVYYHLLHGPKTIAKSTEGTYAFDPMVTVQFAFEGEEIMLRLAWEGDDGRPSHAIITTDRLVIKNKNH